MLAEDRDEAVLLVDDGERVAQGNARPVRQLELHTLVDLEVTGTETLVVDLVGAATQARGQKRCERLTDRFHVSLRELARRDFCHLSSLERVDIDLTCVQYPSIIPLYGRANGGQPGALESAGGSSSRADHARPPGEE